MWFDNERNYTAKLGEVRIMQHDVHDDNTGEMQCRHD